jgi:hypothetical protein
MIVIASKSKKKSKSISIAQAFILLKGRNYKEMGRKHRRDFSIEVGFFLLK